MAHRNIEKLIEKGKTTVNTRPNLDLSQKELIELLRRANNKGLASSEALLTAVSEAYLTGLSVGLQNN